MKQAKPVILAALIAVVLVACPSPTADNPSSISSPKAITAFSFASPAATGTIIEATHTIAVTVPFGTNLTTLVPTISISGASISPASGVAHDFSTSATYSVTAADASTQDYVVTVSYPLYGNAARVIRSGGKTYVAGWYNDGAKQIPCYWVDGVRHNLVGDGSHDAQATAIAVDGTTIYVAGWWKNAAGISRACLWTNGNSVDLPVWNVLSDSKAYAVIVSGGVVYTGGGNFNGNQGAACVWTGTATKTTLSSGGLPNTEHDDGVSALTVYNSTVYAVGAVRPGGPVPVYWTGQSGEGLSINSGCWGFAGGIRIVGGVSYSAGTQWMPTAHYAGALWTGFGAAATRLTIEGDGTHSATAVDLDVVGTTTYVCGGWNDGAATYPCYWIGTTRVDLPGSIPGTATSFPTTGIVVDSGSVYVVGSLPNGTPNQTKPIIWVDGVLKDLR